MTDVDMIEAAGGIVWRTFVDGPRVALVHRPRSHDWTLPKHDLGPDERWEEAAARGVRAETGFNVELEAFAGCSSYRVSTRPKIVLYWHMTTCGRDDEPMDSSEVDEVRWCTLEEALETLTYERERILLAEATGSKLLRRLTDGSLAALLRRWSDWLRKPTTSPC